MWTHQELGCPPAVKCPGKRVSVCAWPCVSYMYHGKDWNLWNQTQQAGLCKVSEKILRSSSINNNNSSSIVVVLVLVLVP